MADTTGKQITANGVKIYHEHGDDHVTIQIPGDLAPRKIVMKEAKAKNVMVALMMFFSEDLKKNAGRD